MDYLNKLRERAEKILLTLPPENKILSYSDAYKLLDEFNLQKIALDLQNEDLKNSQLEIEELRHRYVDLYDFIPFGYFTLSEHAMIIEVNTAGADLIGIRREELNNKIFTRYISPECQSIFYEHIKNSLKKMSLQTCEVKLLRKEGALFYAELNSKALLNSITKEKFLLTFITDINEKKQQQNYLHQYQNKMAIAERNISMEKFATVVAHELNNPLAVISNYLHGCINRCESGDFKINEIIAALKKAVAQSHRIAEIILRMKNFICKGTLNLEVASIDSIIKEALVLINYETSELPIQIQYKNTRNIPLVILDRIHIQQVILNLARNSIEAMRDHHTTEPRLIIETQQLDTNFIELSIIDNGPGLSAENMQKLFDLHFTTKLYGVGIGLAISRSIIESHGGVLSIESNYTGGACFKFTLPIQKIETGQPKNKIPELN